jgi:hypothetical protein
MLKLSSTVQPSWSEGGTTRHNFGRGPSNVYFIKVWFQLSNWLWPPQCSCIVLESSFDPGERLQAPVSLWLTIMQIRHILIKDSSVTCDRLVVFSGYSSFLPINLTATI